MSYIKLKKENNDTNDSELVRNLLNKKIPSLCFSCSNCLDDCQKVFDKKKKPIDQYSFITEGIQVIKNKDDIDRFIVSKCKNYETEKTEEKQLVKRKNITTN